MAKKIIVIDLDGTLLNTNTFHKWLIFLFKKSLLLNPIDSLKIISIISLRLIKSTTHKEMKYRILKISESPKYKEYINQFVDELHQYLNKEVALHVEKENSITILATAAPKLYAESIANRYGFDYSIATPETSEVPWYENIREKKRKSLKKLLASLHIESVDVVISDHHDDIPIMKMAITVLLVNASLESKKLILKSAKLLHVEII